MTPNIGTKRVDKRDINFAVLYQDVSQLQNEKSKEKKKKKRNRKDNLTSFFSILYNESFFTTISNKSIFFAAKCGNKTLIRKLS